MGIDQGWLDLSQLFRETACATTGLLQHIAENVVDNIEVEYVRMVTQTPQHSGSTAASWYVGIYPIKGGTAPVFLPKRSAAAALSKGASRAVNMSLGRADFAGMKTQILNTSAAQLKAIMVENNSRGFLTAEFGPLRSVNNPGGQMAAFQQNVAANMGKHKALVATDYFKKYKRKC